MQIIRASNDPAFKSPVGVQKMPTPDGREAWVAHVNLGLLDTVDAYAVIVGEGGSEYSAINRLLERCKAWSTLLSTGMTEYFSPKLQKIEKEATEELMRQVGLTSSDLGLGANKADPKLGGN
jgi:hypothetical protein